MSLFAEKTKEIIFDPTPLGNRILMHDYRSLRKAEKVLADKMEHVTEPIQFFAGELYKMSIKYRPFSAIENITIEYVG